MPMTSNFIDKICDRSSRERLFPMSCAILRKRGGNEMNGRKQTDSSAVTSPVRARKYSDTLPSLSSFAFNHPPMRPAARKEATLLSN